MNQEQSEQIAALREVMMINARAYNKTSSKSYLEKLSIHVLINFCHPSDRDQYEAELRKIGGIV